MVNAILDHKMHAGTMTDAEAMDLLVGRAFQTEGEAVGKIIRAKQTSCQLSTYFVGRTAFYRLRQQVQRELGDRFDLERYHEAVLSHGTIPVKYLPELVRKSLGLPSKAPRKLTDRTLCRVQEARSIKTNLNNSTLIKDALTAFRLQSGRGTAYDHHGRTVCRSGIS